MLICHTHHNFSWYPTTPYPGTITLDLPGLATALLTAASPVPKLRRPPLPVWLTSLLELPTTWSYTGLTLVLGSLAARLVFSPTAVPTQYLVLPAPRGWLARLGESAARRWAWLGSVRLLVVGLGLEISARVVLGAPAYPGGGAR